MRMVQPSRATTGPARRGVAHDRRPFLGLVTETDVRLDLDALTVFARWVTPAMMHKRFDTWFYVAVAPADQLAVCDGWETVDAEWIAPSEALRLAELGERTVIFPTEMNLDRPKAAAHLQPQGVGHLDHLARIIVAQRSLRVRFDSIRKVSEKA